ncbi:MAG: exonuclease SbcCD subunit D [Gammaproteobacteria bacterium]|nr:exonuclease SbcCD subunit D [Gammaproteobacteria bacterium]MBT3722073.1 exonuclease SbcCD subunit D [Gammaproteobacteria bacterium]MBT4075603.1 exonuclease SbcCD subunit D [Gammaproteobacteria bacterium]MBT4195966.1 exonuclease SbcCD subunit D [Gammaproteobacteria bacterium]MBT4451562.1 exonuclease SbcCD subunit D [Gammaproteobacteria bacterium]
MKFIHTSDWHIGRQFHNVSLLDDQSYVLDQLIQYIKQESVDALIIAGDIYDRSIPPATAVELLDKILKTICVDLSVPVILIPGNHDSAERLRFAANQLKQSGLYILGDLGNVTEPVIIQNKHESLCFYGIPYNDPEHVRNQFNVDLSGYEQAHAYLIKLIEDNKDEQSANIIISHCFVDGAEESESERPLSIGGADRISASLFKGFDYVALGHLHGPQYKNEQYIRYSGSLLKYSFSEQNQHKGVTLVEFDDNTLKEITHLPLSPLHDMRIIEGELEEILQQGRVDPNAEDYLLVRLTDTHAILDAMGKLRVVYPNVLHLEKPGLMASTDQQSVNRDKIRRSELEMFHDFFKQVTGRDLDEKQADALQETVSSLHHSQVDS